MKRSILTALAVLAASSGFAQSWPSKPVKIIVPYPPGGAVDVVTRRMATKLQEQTGQTFFVENKVGATGTIGINQTVQSAPDGYTLVANDTTYALLPHIFKKLPFDHEKDLLPLGAYMFAPMAVVVRTNRPSRLWMTCCGQAKQNPTKSPTARAAQGPCPTLRVKPWGLPQV